MKKKWLFVPVLAGMLVLAVVGGTAFAQSENGDEGSPWSSFAGRVASILGLDEATVQDAMDQARQELQDEAVQAKLDSLVEQGRITQEQADESLRVVPGQTRGTSPRWVRGSGIRQIWPAWMAWQMIP